MARRATWMRRVGALVLLGLLALLALRLLKPSLSGHGQASGPAVGLPGVEDPFERLPAPALRPAGAYARGDPLALTLSGDGQRVLRVDGASLAEFARDDLGDEALRRFDLGAGAFALLENDGRLYVAAGARGLLFYRLDEASPRARVLRRDAGRVCTDVELADGRLWATFGARDDSRLAAFDASDHGALGEFDLPEGLAWAVAARGERAWVALGEAGLARATLGQAAVERGPGAAAFAPPADRRRATSLLRDLALSGAHLVIAADGAGLASVDVDADWSPATPVELQALELDQLPTYACRVSSDGARVAVGSVRAPVEYLEGAPFGLFGWLDARLNVGGVGEFDFGRGSSEGWFLFERGPARWVELARARDTGGWRSLVLRGEYSHEQHIGKGHVLREASSGRVLSEQRPEGIAALDATLARGAPGLVLATIDAQGSRAPGWLRRTDDVIAVSEDTRGIESLGLMIGPQWTDEVGANWCLAGTPLGWRLWRIEGDDARASQWWDFLPPLDPDGRRGAAYFSAVLEGNLLLLVRAQSRYGLLGASARELIALAGAAPSGSRLEFEALFQTALHEGDDPRAMFAWAPLVWGAREDGLTALVPCGFETRGGPEGRARWVTVDLSAAAAGSAPLLGEVLGGHPVGHALACVAVPGAGAPRAVGLDFMGALEWIELDAAGAPRLRRLWSAPREPFDERASNLLGLALEARADAGPRLWVAAGRSGLLGFELDDRGALEPCASSPAVGWTCSVRVERDDQGTLLVVAEQKAGLRLLRPED